MKSRIRVAVATALAVSACEGPIGKASAAKTASGVLAQAEEASPNAKIKGTFANNATRFCNVTLVSGAALASGNQRAGDSGTLTFDGDGGLKVENLSNNFNVPAGTRNTATARCVGTYDVQADNIVTTDVACDFEIIDGAGKGIKGHIPSIKGRSLIVDDTTLFRMPDGPPVEETVVLTFPTSCESDADCTKPATCADDTQKCTITQFRLCSRIGIAKKTTGAESSEGGGER